MSRFEGVRNTVGELLFPRRSIMSAVSSLPARCSVLATLAAAGAVGVVLLPSPQYAQTVPVTDAKAPVINPSSTRLPAATQAHAIRPFRVNVPEAELADLRRRMAATRRTGRWSPISSRGCNWRRSRHSFTTGGPGLAATTKDKLNADLLAFLKG